MSTTDLQKELFIKVEQALGELQLPEKPVTLYEPYQYTLEGGGKRIRPILTLLANGLCKGRSEDGLPAALAVEILHNFTLVHDDIMDSADTRRGNPSVFKKWNENVAILSGDVMFAGAMQQIAYYGSEESFTKQEFADMHEVFLNAVVTVCEGQALDMEFVDRNSVSLEEYIEMISGKTAALLSASLEMGAISAHATSEQREKLCQLGMEMGIAFQIQDDLLDAIADPEKFGKRPGGDIHEGKKTYLTILAQERADKEQADFIGKTLEDNNSSEESVQRVLEIMNTLNVTEDVASEVNSRYEKAKSIIAEFDESEYKKELEKLLIFLQQRDH